MASTDCPTCAALTASQPGARIKHNADGSHTVAAPNHPRAVTDPKPRGRRRG